MAVEMQHVPFSSHVFEIGYDVELEELFVRYAPSVKYPAGHLVVYEGVDAQTATEVISAPSVGGALWEFVRGKYETRG